MQMIRKCILTFMLFFVSTAMNAKTSPQINQISLAKGTIFNISKPGIYEVKENLNFSKKPFIISANNVTLDLQGHTIQFDKKNKYGIALKSGISYVTIKNGSIKNHAGVEPIALSYNKNITLSALNITTAGPTGLLIDNCTNISVRTLSFRGKRLQTGIQIQQSSGASINNCSIQNLFTTNFRGINIQQSKRIVCANNTISYVQASTYFQGIVANNCSQTLLKNNNINLNSGPICMGIALTSGSHNKVVSNEITMNSTQITKYKTEPNVDTATLVLTYHASISDKPKNKFVQNRSSSITTGTVIGVNVDENELSSKISLNTIKDNMSTNAAYGIYIYTFIPTSSTLSRTLYIEKNIIDSNTGSNNQYGIFDEDAISNNAYIGNSVFFHGKSLDGSSMPETPSSNANYFMRKQCQITNVIKEAPVDDINFFIEDLNNKNLSIY